MWAAQTSDNINQFMTYIHHFKPDLSQKKLAAASILNTTSNIFDMKVNSRLLMNKGVVILEVILW